MRGCSTSFAPASTHSRDTLDLLTGKQTSTARDVYSYIGQTGENSEKITLIESKWKLVVNGPNIINATADPSAREILLYDITDDPNETTDRSAGHPEVVRRMYGKLQLFHRLQPGDAVPPYAQREGKFTAPKEWKMPGE